MEKWKFGLVVVLSACASWSRAADVTELALVCEGIEVFNDPLMVKYLGYESKNATVHVRAALDVEHPQIWIEEFEPRLRQKNGVLFSVASKPYDLVKLGPIFLHTSSEDSGSVKEKGLDSLSVSIRLDRRSGELELVDSYMRTTAPKGAFNVQTSKVTGSYVCSKRGPDKF